MKYKLIKLTKENDLNRELRKQKRERGELSILFVSPWDKYCTALLEELEKNCEDAPQNAKPLYIVDNYNMPHSFVIFKSTSFGIMFLDFSSCSPNRLFVRKFPLIL